MKTKTSILSVRVLVLCLTICQFHVSQALEVEEGIQMGHTQTPPVLKAKPSKAKSSAAKRLFYTRTKPTAVTKSVVTTTTVTKTTQNTQVTVAPIQKKAIAPVQQVATQSNTTAPAAPPVIKEDPGVTTPFESFDSTSSHRAGDWLTDDQSVLAPVPKGRMILATVSVSGSSVQSSASTVSTLGTKITVKQNGTGVGPELALSYGLTDHFYLSASGAYDPSTSKTETMANSMNQTIATAADDGWREPQVALGATFEVGEQTRLIGEVNGHIPVGKAHTEYSGKDSRSNGLSGGGTVGPRLVGISKAGPIKLVSDLSYSFALQRDSETLMDTKNSTGTTTGGNSFQGLLALEIPSWLNLGVGGIYINNESSTTHTTDFLVNGTTVDSYSPNQATQLGGGLAYMGIPVADLNLSIMPRVAYLTFLDRNRDGVSIDQSDIWLFGVQAIMHF